jgi:hypothetical protein
MRMPGFSAEMPVYANASGYRAATDATMESGVFPQQACSPQKVAECLQAAAKCAAVCATGNWFACGLCWLQGIDCVACLPNWGR